MCLRVASELVTLLEIPPCQIPMCGVAYSCSYVLLAIRKTCVPCGARHVQNVVVVGLQIALTLVRDRSRIESLFLPRFIAHH